MKKPHRETLDRLYRQLRSPGLSPDERDRIADAIRFRSELAAAIYGLQVLEMTQAELEDSVPRLKAALEPDPELDDVTDAIQREVARVQLDVVAAEYECRQTLYLAADKGDVYLPSRTDLIGALMGLEAQLLDEPETAHFAATTASLLELARLQAPESPPGTSSVVQVLREADRRPPEKTTHKLDPWVRWAVALEFLASERGFAGQQVAVDPVTRAQANRAKRLLYATDRQDPRYDEADWPLDLTGTMIARTLEEYQTATERWAQARIPEGDLVRYLSPIRKEEVERPKPHLQIVPERRVRELATKAGAFPSPLVYAIPPGDRIRTVRQIWVHGLPSVPPNLPGLMFYDAGGDPRVRWGAPPYVYGLLCGIIMRPEEVLHVPHPDHPEDFERFNELTKRAEVEAKGSRRYPEVLREILLAEDIRAVAHYHPTERYLHELVVLDPGPDTVQVIRESVPPFMWEERALILPYRDRRKPNLLSS